MSLRFRVALSVACAVLAGMLFAAYAGQVRAEAERERSEAIARYGGEVVGIVVATRGIEAGETISAADVAERDWVADLVPEGAATSLDDVVGRGVTVPVAKGAPVCALNFREGERALEVPEGMVAVGVPLSDRIGVPPDVAPGSRLIAYATDDDGTALVSSDVTVTGVPDATSSGMGASLTLAVPPDSVPAVLSASAEGTLRLVVPADDVEDAGGMPKASPSVPSVGEGESDG